MVFKNISLLILDQKLINHQSDLISLIILFLFFLLLRVETTSSKKPKSPSFQIGSGWNLAGLFVKQIRVDWRSRIFHLTSYFHDGGHDVISRRKVPPPGEWRWSVCRRLCSSVPPVSDP